MPRRTDQRRVQLGQRIKELRGARDMSQEQLAEKMDANVSYVSSVERAQENPSLEFLMKLADALKVELVDLFNTSWLSMNEHELKKKLKSMVDASDLDGLRELLAMMRARQL